MSIVIDKEFKELADRALYLWGYDAEIDMTIEECSELIQVLIKRNRNGSTIQEIIGELVDVEIMLAQMKNIFDRDMWNDMHSAKLQYLKKRLDESEEMRK